MQFYITKIISQKKIANNIYHLIVAKNDEPIVPGQFYLLKAWDDSLPLMRPVSVFYVENNELHFLYKVVGKGTERLSALKKDAKIELLGALGNGFPCNEVCGKIALVGGGIGIPPLFETAKQLVKNGSTVDAFLGYKDEIFADEFFKKACENVFIAHEKGASGYHGYVTDIFRPQYYDAVFTCGPEIMMEKVKKLCISSKVPVWLSMENRMACGIGACLVCSCKTKNGMKRCCKEGPVFSGDIL